MESQPCRRYPFQVCLQAKPKQHAPIWVASLFWHIRKCKKAPPPNQNSGGHCFLLKSDQRTNPFRGRYLKTHTACRSHWSSANFRKHGSRHWLWAAFMRGKLLACSTHTAEFKRAKCAIYFHPTVSPQSRKNPILPYSPACLKNGLQPFLLTLEGRQTRLYLQRKAPRRSKIVGRI